MQETTSDTRWWSPQEIPEGRTLSCQLGSLVLEVRHVAGEWQLANRYLDETEAVADPILQLHDRGLEDDVIERYLYPGAAGRLTLTPLLADRPVVIRPRQLVYLPSGQQTTMYLSTPVTIRIDVDEPPVTLRELPMLRLSDTWFGPSTREGELCYSGRTTGRHELADIPRRVHRAVTPLTIRNNASTVLPLEKISLPVPVLSIYGADDGQLWTQGLVMERGGDSDMAALKIDATPPSCAGTVRLLAGPRQLQARGSIVRAFSLLFGDV